MYVKEQSCNRLLWNGLQKFNLLILGGSTQILGIKFRFDYTVQELVKFEKGVGIGRKPLGKCFDYNYELLKRMKVCFEY